MHVCGRFVRTFTIADLVAELGVTPDAPLDETVAAPNFNIAPTALIPVVGVRDGLRMLRVMEWGLIPKWSKDDKQQSSMINARVETALEKPSFRSLTNKHRVVVPMSGFYEWNRAGAAKQPFYILDRTRTILPVAGLWSSWDDPRSGLTRSTVAILTTAATSDINGIHDRMPCVLERDEVDSWLDSGTNPLQALTMAAHVKEGLLRSYPISVRVNSVQNNDFSLLEEIPV